MSRLARTRGREANIGAARTLIAAGLLTVALVGCIGATSTTVPTELPPTQTQPTTPASLGATGSPIASSTDRLVGELAFSVDCFAIRPAQAAPPWPSPFEDEYELRFPSDYQVTGPPYEVHDADGNLIAKEGDQIEVVGTFPSTSTSFCMIGPILEVTEMQVVAGG